MPRRIDMIPDKQDSIIRPVAIQVARQLMKILNIPEEVTLFFPGIWEEGIQTGSAVNSQQNDPSTFKYSKRFQIEVTEKAVEDRVMATAVHRRENHAIFLDKALSVAIYPITVGTQMEFNITYRAKTRTEAKKFRDDILVHFGEGRSDYFHELDYHYNIPYDQMDLLKDIHALREAKSGYGESLETWINEHITDRATNTATIIGSQKKVSIREKQISPTGFFDFAGAPEEGTKDREGATINVEFRYTLTYDQVVGCVVQYPLSIHGQFIGDRWYSMPNASGTIIAPIRRNRAPSLSRGYFDVIAHQTPNWERLQYEPVKTPYFDDWKPDYRLPFTTCLIQAMVGVDAATPRTLFNIDDIEDFKFDYVIKEFLMSEAAYACDFKNSIFHCALYEDYNPMDDAALRLQPDLTFVGGRDLDPRKQYHIQISLLHTLNSLSYGARERLRNSGEAGVRILEWLQQNLRGYAFLPTLQVRRIEHLPEGPVTRGVIKNEDLRRIEEILDRRPGRDSDRWYPNGIMKTAGQFGIIAHRRIPNELIEAYSARS